MTRTRCPPRRISWGAGVFEREGWRGAEAEEVVEVVDRRCWTLHRLGSIKMSELVFVQGKIPNNEMVRRKIQSRSLPSYVLKLQKLSVIRKTLLREYTYRLKREVGQVQV